MPSACHLLGQTWINLSFSLALNKWEIDCDINGMLLNYLLTLKNNTCAYSCNLTLRSKFRLVAMYVHRIIYLGLDARKPAFWDL